MYEYCFDLPGPPRIIIDAGEEKCNLHPNTRCPGRLINHGERSANLKPKDITLHHLTPPPRFLVLKASRLIEPFEELLFNYGDRKNCRDIFGRD